VWGAMQTENKRARAEIEHFVKLKNSFDRVEAENMFITEQNKEMLVLFGLQLLPRLRSPSFFLRETK